MRVMINIIKNMSLTLTLNLVSLDIKRPVNYKEICTKMH